MGQYYRVILTNAETGYERVYNRYVDKKYTMAKLMEHSWWRNEFVSTICNKLFKHPMRVAWVGDYADGMYFVNDIPHDEIVRLCKKAWQGKGYGIKKKELYLENLYLVNHTKKIYMDCNEYKYNCMSNDGWCIHPLPILTVIGNGLGGGDYRSPTADSTTRAISSWANDLISIEENIPEGYEKKSYVFKEE